AITKLLKGELPGPEASTGKMMWVEGHQRLQELAMEIQGPYSQIMKGSPRAVAEGLWQHTFLRSRANSIEGGTTEVQRNIIGEQGWLGLIYPEAYDGMGLGLVDLVVLMEEMGRTVVPGPYFSTVLLGGLAILEAGSEVQKKEWLPRVATGGTRVTLAWMEPSA